jgi:hypothetical protein
LKYGTDKDCLKLQVPPSTDTVTLEFGFSETTDDVVKRLKKQHQIDPLIPYGLYYKRIGLWLEGRRHLISYEIEPDVSIFYTFNNSG